MTLKVPITLSYYLKVSEFLKNTIIIPTENLGFNKKLSFLHFSGVSNIYNSFNDKVEGNCSASLFVH